MKYLHADKKDEQRVRQALGSLAANDDWRCVCEHLLKSTVHHCDTVIRDMPIDDVQLPIYQGVARGITELIEISAAGRNDQPTPSPTPHPIM